MTLYFDGQCTREREEPLAPEAPLEIRINDQDFVVTMRTPGDDEALIRGFLHSEGIATLRAGVGKIAIAGDVASVTIPPVYLCADFATQRNSSISSACGICGTRRFVPLTGQPLPELRPKFGFPAVAGCMEKLRTTQTLFEQTGGVHGVAAFAQTGQLIASAEDIGRHNAVDKVIGKTLLHPQHIQVLAISGRISYEIVAKAYRAQIPIVLAVSAPTSLAVQTAERLGVTLLAFCRQKRATVYSTFGNVRRELAITS